MTLGSHCKILPLPTPRLPEPAGWQHFYVGGAVFRFLVSAAGAVFCESDRHSADVRFVEKLIDACTNAPMRAIAPELIALLMHVRGLMTAMRNIVLDEF